MSRFCLYQCCEMQLIQVLKIKFLINLPSYFRKTVRFLCQISLSISHFHARAACSTFLKDFFAFLNSKVFINFHQTIRVFDFVLTLLLLTFEFIAANVNNRLFSNSLSAPCLPTCYSLIAIKKLIISINLFAY